MLPDRYPDIKVIRNLEEEYFEIDLSEDNILTHHFLRLWDLYNRHGDDSKLIYSNSKNSVFRHLFSVQTTGDTDGELFMMLNTSNVIPILEYTNSCHCCGISLDIIPHIGCLCERCIDRLGETNEHDDSHLMFPNEELEVEELEVEPVILP